MKKFLPAFLFFLVLCFGLNTIAFGKIRVFIVSGGHPFDKTAFREMFDSFEEFDCTFAEFPEAWDLMTPALKNDFDVLLLYDMWQKPLTDEQKANFKALYQSGIGIYALHHDLCAHVNWDEYYDLAGARIFYGETTFRGVKYPGSTFKAGKDLPMHVVDSAHPVTKEMTDFVIHDEAYGNLLVHPEVEPLLTSTHPEQTRVTAWVWHCGKSTVLGNLLGHDRISYENENFRKLIRNGIHFLADEKK